MKINLFFQTVIIWDNEFLVSMTYFVLIQKRFRKNWAKIFAKIILLLYYFQEIKIAQPEMFYYIVPVYLCSD